MLLRTWRFWLHTIILSSQYNPPRFVEILMLLLAMVLLGMWTVIPSWPYLALCLSFIVGSSTSILVREAIAPSSQPKLTQLTALVLLLVSIYTIVDLVRYM